jgi:DNA-binding response OmpR family regulator
MTKVLVVDDDADLLEMVSLVLTRYNMKVNPLEKCLQFQDTVSSDIPDIVLMDIYLGECDGRELCLKFKKSSTYPGIPVILYSAGNVTQASVNDSLADEFMAKPFDIQRLVNRINHHLNTKKTD